MIWLLVVTMLLIGCASPPRTGPQPEALRYYPLLLPSTYGGTLVIEQLLDGSVKGEHFKLHSQLEIDAHQIQVLGFTAFQTRAFALQ